MAVQSIKAPLGNILAPATTNEPKYNYLPYWNIAAEIFGASVLLKFFDRSVCIYAAWEMFVQLSVKQSGFR